MSKSSYERYINSVINNIKCNGKIRRKIKEDLLSHIQLKALETGENDPWKLMGDPHEVAEEFRENLNIKEGYEYGYEYISETKIFGLPLVHINTRRNGFAKGIIACGGFSVGIISIGGISLGLLSFGGISLGLLFAFAGVSISPIIAIGAFTISYYLAAGAFAVSKYIACGAYAKANIAIGDAVRGIIGAYKTEGIGDIMMKMPVDKELFFKEVRNIYPEINSISLKILKLFIR